MFSSNQKQFCRKSDKQTSFCSWKLYLLHEKLCNPLHDCIMCICLKKYTIPYKLRHANIVTKVLRLQCGDWGLKRHTVVGPPWEYRAMEKRPLFLSSVCLCSADEQDSCLPWRLDCTCVVGLYVIEHCNRKLDNVTLLKRWITGSDESNANCIKTNNPDDGSF